MKKVLQLFLEAVIARGHNESNTHQKSAKMLTEEPHIVINYVSIGHEFGPYRQFVARILAPYICIQFRGRERERESERERVRERELSVIVESF